MNDQPYWKKRECWAAMASTYTEPINELTLYKLETKMNDIKLVTQEDFKTAIRSLKFIVGSVDSFGNLSFSSNPRTHDTRALARAECNRLAKATPGKLYVFVRFEGAEFLPQVVATQSI